MTTFDHVDAYPEIPVSVASTRTALKTGAWRSVRPVLTEQASPCRAACPAGVAIPTYLRHIVEGDTAAAFAEVARRNPFPRITGRVCPHRCEGACNLTTATGAEPVSVRAIERWLGDATADLPHPMPDRDTLLRIAVVGSGPAGLAAAYYLRRSGHDVTVFERRALPGGVLRYGIPDYRLPGHVVDAEVDRLEQMGIDFRTGIALGTDVTLGELEEAFAAVFVATGAWRERVLGIEGDHLLERGLAFLEAASRGEAMVPGPRCAVIGGGNTAMDVARTLRKLGADVTILYRRTAMEMPAIREEYERALDDGVTFEWLVVPRHVDKGDDGLVVTVEEVRLGAPDGSGRRSPVPIGVTWDLHFDGVFAAIGETADMGPLPLDLVGGDGWLRVGDDGSTARRRVFAGGDVASGPATVVEAIASGRRAARAIDQVLGFGALWPDDAMPDVVPVEAVNPAHAAAIDRAAEVAPARREPFAEDTMTLNAAAVLDEIERCLSCGHCSGCGTCLVFCPDGAISWDDGPVIDLEFCKGCGICVVECPGHALALVNEREVSHA